MIYKFIEEAGEKTLELYLSNYTGDKVILSIEGNGIQHIALDKDSVYDLIGALHTLKSKINSNG